MGGVYGNAIAIALEHCPVNARGLMSGILQQGYSFGYVLAACANLGVGGSTDSWKVGYSALLVYVGAFADNSRLYSGSVLVSPLALESFGSSFLKANNFLRQEKLGIPASQRLLSGKRRDVCS